MSEILFHLGVNVSLPQRSYVNMEFMKWIKSVYLVPQAHFNIFQKKYLIYLEGSSRNSKNLACCNIYSDMNWTILSEFFRWFFKDYSANKRGCEGIFSKDYWTTKNVIAYGPSNWEIVKVIIYPPLSFKVIFKELLISWILF